MMRLTTLGTTDLRDDHGAVAESVLRQPRRLALLVFLVLESRPGYVRRDRALATFWPEVTTEQGRRSLSQALHYLRQALGPATIVARGQDELRIDRERLQCDVCEFLDAASASDHEAALRLFTGEFLPGFFCAGVPDFEHWLDLTRAELRRTAAEAGWAAAEHARQAREWVTAAAAARRAAELAGSDETATRRLMEFLADIGDRAGALEAYEALTRRLQLEYEATPSAATRQLVARVRTQPAAGLQLTSEAPAPTAEPGPASSAAPGLHEPAGPAGAAAGAATGAAAAEPAAAATDPAAASPRYRLGQRLRSAVVTAVLMVSFIALWGLRESDSAEAAAPARARVVVEEPRGEGVSVPALPAEIVRQLTGSERIDVLVAGAPARHRADALDLALRTTFGGSSSALRATVSLVDRASGKTVASSAFSGQAASPEDIAELAAQITAFARRSAGDELERRRAELAGVGRELLADFQRAQRQLAIADSLAGAGLTAVARVHFAAADSQLAAVEHRAQQWIAPPIVRAEVAYSRVWTYLFPPHQDERAARAALLEGAAHAARAIDLDPQDARGHELRGLLRYFLWATAPADSGAQAAPLLAQSRVDLERATSLSRDASRAWNYLSVILFQAGDFPQAYAAGRNALHADEFMRNTIANHVRLFWSALEVGDLDGARQWCRSIDQLNTDSSEGEHCTLVLTAWDPERFPLDDAGIQALKASALSDPAVRTARFDAVHAVILAHAQRHDEARALLRSLEADAATDAQLLVDAAWVYSALGQHATARRLLREFIAGNPLNRQGVARSARFTASSGDAGAAGALLASSRR